VGLGYGADGGSCASFVVLVIFLFVIGVGWANDAAKRVDVLDSGMTKKVRGHVTVGALVVPNVPIL
jgi:hypothetical protein